MSDPAVASSPRPPLDVVQRWFQAVVTHPGGVDAGIGSPTAQALLRLDRGSLEELVRGSSRLSAEQRLAIYANAFYARLLECLGDSFPALKRLLGSEVFDGFAFEYLQSYPSRSYTLDRLAESFPRFLEETRPDAGRLAGAPASFADLLIDLATLELAVARVFDGAGCEGQTLLAGGLPQPFAIARLTPVPCLRLLRFSHPLHDLYTALRALPDDDLGDLDELGDRDDLDDAAIAIPEPQEEHVALSRTDFVVRRYRLDRLERDLLAALLAGSTVGEAIAVAAASSDLGDDPLAVRIDAAFARFTAAGFFLAATS